VRDPHGSWTRWAAVLAALVTLLATATIASATTSWQDKVDASVLRDAQDGHAQFLVYLDQKADLSGASQLATKEEKGRHVYEQLTATAKATQPAVVATLEQNGADTRGFWVSNVIQATGGLAALEAVASRADVEHVYALGSGTLQLPDAPGGAESVDFTTTVFDSIALVNADDAWASGYRGQGAVVAGADTGVRWTHEAIKGKYRGWDGSTASHDYNWHDAIHNPNVVCPPDSPEPCDDDAFIGGGHGTHTVGTMVGSGPDVPGQKNEFGMAPDAKWIACRNMNNGAGIVPMYMECMEWFIAPTRIGGSAPDPSKAPHVVNNSWGCVEVCPPPLLRDTLQASRAAGIFYAVSAGNDGGRSVAGQPAWICSSIYHPLARYPEAFTVGSTQWTNDTISPFSSRGPVVLGDPPDQLLLTKPNITAPGSAIRSALAGSDSAYGSLNGTSMAGPHVAGLVALIISANPGLAGQVEQIEDIIEQTAVRKTTNEMCGLDSATQVPNNTYGWGRINALAAVEAAIAQRPDLRVSSIRLDSGSRVKQGDTVTVTATVTNAGSTTAGPSQTEFLLDGATVLDLVDTGSIAPGDSRDVSIEWSTRHVANGDHELRVTADSNGQVAETDETNNSRASTVTVRGNKVRNASFEGDANADGTPDGWTGQSTGAGSAQAVHGGSDGSTSAQTSGNGGNAALHGAPTWTSAAIPVTPGSVLDFEAAVSSTSLSSPASAGLAYLNAAGAVVGRVTLATAPLGTAGFDTLAQIVTIPAGVAQVRVVLTGFAPTDLATAGSTSFDEVGLFER
jgi:serine protease AprX